MSFDDVVLSLQSLIDRVVRRLRLGPPPERAVRRLLIIQIDGLPRSVFEEALARGRMPFVRRLLHGGAFRMTPMNVGLPTSTPAFHLAAMYGVRPDIPGFHYHDKKRHDDLYFPRAGDAAHVEATQARDRRGILHGGSSYGCVFTGGAINNFFSFAMLKRPSGTGLLRVLSVFVVMLWVVAKCIVLTTMELLHAVLRLLADPVSETARFKWLAIKIGLSVWVRQCFTLAVSSDLYRGVPAIYVNYLDYDVFAHAYGPRSARAFRSLRRIDASIRQLWNVMRRVPEHQYDLYLLSDHGQTATTPYHALHGGVRIERRLFDEFFDPSGTAPTVATRPFGQRLLAAVHTLRRHRSHGTVQRFLNYLERDFLSWLGDVREAHERAGVRVVAAGPNAFVYFMYTDDPVPVEALDERWPGLVDELSRSRGIGFVLVRTAGEPVCVWRGKRYALGELREGPFAGRTDVDLVAAGIRDLMSMRCAGDLVLYGHNSPDGDISFISEQGAHAGPSADEMQTFVVHAAETAVPVPLRHPIQLYDHFIRYHATGRDAR